MNSDDLLNLVALSGEGESSSGLDFKDILTVVKIVKKPDVNGDGKVDLRDVLAVASQNPAKVAALFSLIGKLFNKKKTPGPATVSLALPPTPMPTAVETIHPSVVTPAVPVQLALPLIARLKLKLYFVEVDKGGIMDQERFRGVRDAGDNLPSGARIHYDITPYDATGAEIGPGNPALAQLLKANGRPEMTYHWNWDGTPESGPDQPTSTCPELHSYDDDYGCTPVIKIPKDAEDKKDHGLSLYVRALGLESNSVHVNIS